MADLIPLQVSGPHGWDGPPVIFPFLGVLMILLLLLLLAAGLFLLRSGALGSRPGAAARQAPEYEAKQVLAARFARGEITTEEFLERASILNWTPGNDTWPPPRGRRTR